MRTNTWLYPIAAVLLWAPLVGAADWRPVGAAELAQKTPKVDPAADAEAIFWDVKIEDRWTGNELQLVMNHYVRIKIFTDHGKEEHSTVENPPFRKPEDQ